MWSNHGNNNPDWHRVREIFPCARDGNMGVCPMQNHLRQHLSDPFGVWAWLSCHEARTPSGSDKWDGAVRRGSPKPNSRRIISRLQYHTCPETDSPPKVVVARHRRAWYKIDVSEVTTWS